MAHASGQIINQSTDRKITTIAGGITNTPHHGMSPRMAKAMGIPMAKHPRKGAIFFFELPSHLIYGFIIGTRFPVHIAAKPCCKPLLSPENGTNNKSYDDHCGDRSPSHGGCRGCVRSHFKQCTVIVRRQSSRNIYSRGNRYQPKKQAAKVSPAASIVI